MTGLIPIVCFHLGPHAYVEHVMAQAKEWNPETPIILLTEQPASRFPGIHVLPILDYSKEAIEFQKDYVHRSTNSYDIELVCLQRWIVMSAALKNIQCQRCFVMDSDVLLYCNIQQVSQHYSEYLFTLTYQMSPGECFFNTEIVHKFAETIQTTYREKDNYYWRMTDAWYKSVLNDGGKGGISDMAFLYLFSGGYASKWLDSMHIVNNATFDHHVNTSFPGFEMHEGKKKLTWINNQPYGNFTERGRQVRFRSLHFQGLAKPMIEQCRRQPHPESILD